MRNRNAPRRPVFVAGLLIFVSIRLFAQVDQRYSDSLKALLDIPVQLSDSSRLVVLAQISMSDPDPEEIIKYGNKLLELSKKLGVVENEQMAHLYIGNGYKYLGNLNLAITHFYRSAAIADSIGDKKALGAVYGSIGSLHRQNKNFSGQSSSTSKVLIFLEVFPIP